MLKGAALTSAHRISIDEGGNCVNNHRRKTETALGSLIRANLNGYMQMKMPTEEKSAYLVHFMRECVEKYQENDWRGLFPLQALLDMLMASFLDPEIQRGFELQIKRFHTALEELAAQFYSTVGEWNELENAIGEYLDAYFLLMRHTLQYWKDLKQCLDYTKFLRVLLNLGCDYSNKASNEYRKGILTPLAPSYVAALWEIARQFSGCEAIIHIKDAENAQAQNGWSAQTHQEILLTHVYRYMRWIMVSPDGELCHAALRSYTEEDVETDQMSLSIRSLKDYSSYEGIGELRLFEKIKYELEAEPERRINQAERNTFYVLVAGDIHVSQFGRSARMLKGWIENSGDQVRWADSKKLRVHFILLTQNQSALRTSAEAVKAAGNDRVSLEVVRYEQTFRNRMEFERLIKHSDLLFFLDCREFYDELQVVSIANLDVLLQQTENENYRSMQKRLDETNASMLPGNRFFEMQELLCGAAYTNGKPARFKKSVNMGILSFLDKSLKYDDNIREPSYIRAAYVYYSDLEAARDLYWKEDCFVRTERYSGKKFAILRLGTKRIGELEYTKEESERTIVFNLWQFIKHIAISQTEKLLDYFHLQSEEELYLLSEIFIGIDYRNWPEVLRISYHYADKLHEIVGFEERLNHYLDEIVLRCFYKFDRNDHMYQQYFRQCIASFLYSDAKNVDDMLFLHVFSHHFERLKRVEWAEERNRPLKKPQIYKLKYSDKRFYQEVIMDYDEPSQYFANQYRKIELMRQNGARFPQKVFSNILEVCKNNHYEDSYLYRNCIDMLQNNL